MRAAYYERTGSAAETIVVGDVEKPCPGPGEVLVRLYASGVNPSDVKARAGQRAGQVGLPYPRIIPHSDGAGIIEAVGVGVEAGRIGNRVWIWNGQWQRPFGTAAEYIAVPADQTVPLSDNVSFEQGACFGIPALTAHACVFSNGSLLGRTVVITGGAGTVGALAVRMAKLAGAHVIATTGGADQDARAQRAGADALVRHRSPDLGEQIRVAAAGRDIDLVVEVEFGSNIDAIADVIAPHGVIAAYGSAACLRPELPFYALLFKAITVQHILVYTLSPGARWRAISDIGVWLTAGELEPELSATFPLVETAAAHEAVERGGKLGSVVVAI